MVFAWELLQYQVRITGVCEKLSPEESDILFKRCRTGEKSYYLSCSQGKDHPFTQSAPFTDLDAWTKYKEECNIKFMVGGFSRPPSWGGWIVKPQTIEIQDLQALLSRKKWVKQEDGKWKFCYLAD